MSITIWHNPRCTKSRQALALLEEIGIAPDVRLYLKDAPSVAEIKTALDALGLSPVELMRKGEKTFAELALKGADDEALISAMASHPILIERPIVFSGEKAAVGRPTEAILDILP